MLSLLLMTLAIGNPVADAEKDIQTYLQPEDYRYIVIEKDDLPVVSFCLNSVSTARRIVQPKNVEDNLYRIRLSDYNIPAKVWDEVAKQPYIKSTAILRAKTKSNYPVVRGDVLAANLLLPKNYRKLLNFKDLSSFKEQLGIGNENLGIAGIDAGGSKARASSIIWRLPALTGYAYEMRIGYDYVRNPLETKYTTNLVLASLPNGLQAYFVADEKGKPLDEVDCREMTDNKSPDRLMMVGRSCAGCHSNGVEVFKDLVRQLDPKWEGDEEKVKKLEVVFGSEFPFKKDQEQYQKAVRAATGKDSIADEYLKLLEKYNKLVDLEAFTAETGLTEDQLLQMVKASAAPDVHFLGLLRKPKSIPVRRDVFEALLYRMNQE